MDDSDIEIKQENNEPAENSEHSSRHSKELESLPGMYNLLPDPYNDRQIKDLPLPPNMPMDDSTLFVYINELSPVGKFDL
jgi:hypothetical protein